MAEQDKLNNEKMIIIRELGGFLAKVDAVRRVLTDEELEKFEVLQKKYNAVDRKLKQRKSHTKNTERNSQNATSTSKTE